MAKFDMMTLADVLKAGRTDLYEQTYAINDRYFTIDTADHETIRSWERRNPSITTYAIRNDTTQGFFNIMPVTREAAALLERQELREEDIRPEYVLPPELLSRAETAYFAAIAIRDTQSFTGRQCAAALLSVIASQLLHGYRQGVLRRLFANPTTYAGNAMIRRLGLKPLIGHKKPLKANDIYVADMTPERIAALETLEARYARFVGDNPWAQKV